MILDLLSTLRGHAMPVRGLVAAAEIFDFTENNLRVALARLVARGLVERNERGQYGLAPGAQPVQSHVASWSDVAERMVSWTGAWIAAHTGSLGRSRRPASRRRQRALEFIGLRELETNLWVRPDNLRGGVAALRTRLYELGLESSAPVFVMAELEATTEARAHGLWDGAALLAGYTEMQAALARSAAHLRELPLEQAMVESFMLGGRVLRAIAYDPLLPEPIVPAAGLASLVQDMRHYDRVGRGCWAEFMRRHGAPHAESPLRLRVIATATSRPAAREATYAVPEELPRPDRAPGPVARSGDAPAAQGGEAMSDAPGPQLIHAPSGPLPVSLGPHRLTLEPPPPYPAAMVNVTNRCNLECKHCFVFRKANPNDPTGEMTPDEVLQELERLRDRHGIRFMLWMGGEPMIRWRMLEKGVALFEHNTITTNGTIPLKDFGRDITYVISLDGPRDINDAVRGEGVYDRVMQTLAAIPHGFRPTVTVQCVLHRENQHRLEDLVQALHPTKAQGLVFSFLVPRYGEHSPRAWDSVEEREAAVDIVFDLKRRYPDFIWNSSRSLELMRPAAAKLVTDHCAMLQTTLPLYLEGKQFTTPFCCYGNDVDCDRCGAWGLFATAAKLPGPWDKIVPASPRRRAAQLSASHQPNGL